MNYTEFQKFKNSITKSSTPKRAKIRNSWGVCDCYRDIRRHHWYDIERPLKKHEFCSIIREVNKLLAEEISNGNEIKFPSKMGKLEIRKFKTGVKLKNGKVKNTYPIDWDKTLQLWYNDQESRNNKTLVRKESKHTYYIKYTKFRVNYENQSFYEFAVNRFVKRALIENVNNGNIETLW